MALQNLKKQEQVIFQALESLSEPDIKKLLKEYIKHLVNDGKAEPQLYHFLTLAQKYQGVVKVEVTVAHDLDEEVARQIKKLFGDNVEITEKIDATIIGGFIARTSERVIDASIKGKLDNLRTHLVG
jgi:ATP synthase F1 delta subunit